jgi:ABC-type multidrug transport system ATPase subunit
MDESSAILKIVFKNLSWVVDVPNTDAATKKSQPTVQKKVLDNVSGCFRPGKLTAVMGSSGAGQTMIE